MANVILRVKKEDGSWAEIPALVGPQGPPGVSIADIVLKSQEGGVSTYSFILTDGTEKTFQITDGAIITDISLISTDVLIDTYQISISDGSSFNFKVTNGKGIRSIAKTSTDVLSDTYTISYNDNTTNTFQVTNGRSITQIVKSNTDVLTDTYTISYNDNTTSTYTITNGRGIDYIEKDETIGLSDRYTIHYNDGSTSYYHVINGEAGPAGSIGNRIYLSGLVNKVNDEEGYERVKELKESDFDLSKFTAVGSPVISEDGIASGFELSNYISVPEILLGHNFKLYLPFTLSNTISETQIYCMQADTNLRFLCAIGSEGNVYFNFQDDNDVNSGNLNILDTNEGIAGDSYTAVIELKNGTLTYGYIHDDIYTQKGTAATTLNFTTAINNFWVGCGNSEGYNGSIDLKQFSITVDGKEVFSGNPTALDTIKANNYTVTGSPTITDDGMFKANANGDRIAKTGFTNEIKKELRCDGRFYYFTKASNTGNVINLANGSIVTWTINSDGLITLQDGTNTSTVQIEIPLKDGDIFDTEIIYNASNITLNVCLNEGVNYTTSIASQGLTTFRQWYLSPTENYWGGTIDLNTVHVYIDGNLVYQPCLKIPYTKAKTGSKIVDAAYKLRVEDCYNQYGAGNYYLFSSATEQFALPMPDIYGLIEDLDNKKVNRAGDTLTGDLTFAKPNNDWQSIYFKTPNGVMGSNNGSTAQYAGRFVSSDKNGTLFAETRHYIEFDGSSVVSLQARNKTSNGTFNNHYLVVRCYPSGSGGVEIDGKLVAAHITETYVNGTSGYIVYSNGYCEQWGYSSSSKNVSITLTKPFKNTYYHVFLSKIADSSGSGIPTVKPDYTNSSFIVNSYKDTSQPFWWLARGYIA